MPAEGLPAQAAIRVAAKAAFAGVRRHCGSGSSAQAAWCKTVASQPRSRGSLLRVCPARRAETTGAPGNALRLSWPIVLMRMQAIISE
jgi:hypothetical protein